MYVNSLHYTTVEDIADIITHVGPGVLAKFEIESAYCLTPRTTPSRLCAGRARLI